MDNWGEALDNDGERFDDLEEDEIKCFVCEDETLSDHVICGKTLCMDCRYEYSKFEKLQELYKLDNKTIDDGFDLEKAQKNADKFLASDRFEEINNL